MSAPLIRILSDIHYADRASAVRALEQLAPLSDGVDTLILNGDTTDTRPQTAGRDSAQVRVELAAFAEQSPARVEFVTGNHDPDISNQHLVSLADGSVLVTHGDILFDDIVPWGRDSALARKLVAAARLEIGDGADLLQQHLLAHRRAAFAIPQRHQSEKHGLKYLAGFLTDTIWPPDRVLRILDAWRQMPVRAQTLAQTHSPQARFVITGHTHRAGIWHRPGGLVVINTGSFCPLSGRLAVDILGDQLCVRRIDRRGLDFQIGRTVAQFTLTPAPPSSTPSG